MNININNAENFKLKMITGPFHTEKDLPGGRGFSFYKDLWYQRQVSIKGHYQIKTIDKMITG